MAISPELQARRAAEEAARATGRTAGEGAALTEANREVTAIDAARIAAATAEGRYDGYRNGLREQRNRLEARAQAMGEEPRGWFRRLGARYNNMRWYNKLLLTGGLIGGAVTFGSLVPMLAVAAKAGLVGQRFAGYAGMFYKSERWMENRRGGTFFANRSNGQRTAMAAAFAGLYTLGAGKVVGEALSYAGESSWAHTATDWLRAHWPFKSGMFAAAPAAVTEPPPAAPSITTVPTSIDSAYLNSSSGGPEYSVNPEIMGPPEPMTVAEQRAQLASLLRSESFIPKPADEALSTRFPLPQHDLEVLTNPPSLADTLEPPPAPLDLDATPHLGSLVEDHTHLAAEELNASPASVNQILHPEPLVAENTEQMTRYAKLGGPEVLNPPSLADTVAPVPEQPPVPLSEMLHPEPLVPEAPLSTPVPPTPDAANMSFAEFNAAHPTAEIPKISVDASAGRGYEFMTKRLWDQLQDKHLNPTDFEPGSDIRRLIEAKSSDIDKVVHDIATDRGFYHADGTSTLIDPKAHLSFGSDGQLHFGDPAHNLDVVQSPEGAKTTPIYRPEIQQAAPVAENPDSHTNAPSVEPHGSVAEAMEKVQADEHADPQRFTGVQDAEGNTHHYMVDENKKLREITIGEDGNRHLSDPIRDAYTPPPEAVEAAPAETSSFQVNALGVEVDPNHVNVGLDGQGNHIVAGGSVAERQAEALRIFNKDHTEIYYESTPEKHWWQPSPKVEVSKIILSDGAPTPVKVTDVTNAPSIDDIKKLYSPE